MRFPRFFIGVAAAIVTASATPAARAQIHGGTDLNLAVAGTDIREVGIGVDGRVGYRFALPIVWVQPEGVGGFQQLAFSDYSVTYGRALVGGRVGLKGLVQPNVFVHVGGAFGNEASIAVDAGGAVDLKISIVNVGAHVTYVFIGERGNALGYLALGPHLGLTI